MGDGGVRMMIAKDVLDGFESSKRVVMVLSKGCRCSSSIGRSECCRNLSPGSLAGPEQESRGLPSDPDVKKKKCQFYPIPLLKSRPLTRGWGNQVEAQPDPTV